MQAHFQEFSAGLTDLPSLASLPTKLPCTAVLSETGAGTGALNNVVPAQAAWLLLLLSA